jgi:alkanesulfonate monooxygenase SsuD/methylene tetrahydromethanopterin reductase-like flavin-dependent oxidoreductase (luciferase family)
MTLPPERLQATLTVGDPDEVGERVGALFDAGLDGLVFNMPNPWDLDAVALAGETLSRAAAASTQVLASGR